MHVSICLLCASATSTSAACVHKTLQLASSTASGEPQPLRIHARSVTGTRTRSWPISHSTCPAGGWARPPGRLLFLADGANRTEDGQHRFLARWIALEIDLERWSPAWLAWRRGSASRHHQADCSRGRGGGVRRGAPHRGARRRARRHRQRRSDSRRITNIVFWERLSLASFGSAPRRQACAMAAAPTSAMLLLLMFSSGTYFTKANTLETTISGSTGHTPVRWRRSSTLPSTGGREADSLDVTGRADHLHPCFAVRDGNDSGEMSRSVIN